MKLQSRMNNIFHNTKSPKAGFTLVELILYVGILVILLGASVLSALSAANTRVKALARHEVNYSTQFAQDVLSHTIRRAQSIDSGASTFDNASSVLVLIMDDPLESPTTFELTTGQLTVTRGAGAAIPITTGHVDVPTFQVENLSRGSKVNDVRITLLVEHKNPSNLSQFFADLTTVESFSLRQKQL